MVQQPEVHLHPRAQAALGDVFFQAAHAHKKVLFIETHSDFMIDRFRLNYGPSKPRADFAQILFFERTGGGNKLTTIKILSDGEYPEDQAAQFRSFFLEEQRKLLGF
jgi:predicted ATPase